MLVLSCFIISKIQTSMCFRFVYANWGHSFIYLVSVKHQYYLLSKCLLHIIRILSSQLYPIAIKLKSTFININYHNVHVNLVFIDICFVCGFCHSREFWTHLQTPLSPLKDSKVWPILGTQSHWANGLFRHTLRDTRHPFIMVFPKDPWHLLTSFWLWGAVTTCF